jgi:3-deoxy-D-manno-octulosonic-acid transferase
MPLGSRPARRITAGVAPFDHPGTLRRFLAAHGALGLCLYEAELWPNAVAVCGEAGLPVVQISARLTERAARLYRRFGGAGARLLDRLAWIQAQSPSDRDRFAVLTRTETLVGFDFKAAHFLDGVTSVERSGGSAPSPRVPSPVPYASPSPNASGSRTRFAFVSLHYAELLLLLPSLPRLMAHSGLVVFPRRLSETGRFRAGLEPLGFGLHSRDPEARHVLVDAMGLIGAWLPRCHSAFVGGSLVPVGCHNLWEPLTAGTKIIFGPHFRNQQELADRLIGRGIGAVLEDPAGVGSLLPPDPGIPAACRAFGPGTAPGAGFGPFRGWAEDICYFLP